MTPAELDRAILDGHASDDRPALVRLYATAADRAEASGDEDATCFFLTQAYVFALETGHDTVDDLHARLLRHGREE
ncbi:MAG: hypothetical protein AAF317_07570 [Pseudomonadota bacterium]